jgi:pimeloyl-ACP methyl ester carboxylesterase
MSSNIASVSKEDLQEALDLLSIIREVGKSAAHAHQALRGVFPAIVPISSGGSEGIAINTGSDLLLVFQGTNDAVDVLRDLNFSKVRAPGGCIHRGFREAFVKIRDEILAAVAYLDPSGTMPIMVSGHSLGGAIALQAAVDLKLRGKLIGTITVFGCPKVGDAEWAGVFAMWGLDVIRYAHHADVVPLLPPFRGYMLPKGRTVYVGSDGSLRTKRALSVKFIAVTWWAWLLMSPLYHKLGVYKDALGCALHNKEVKDG